MDAHKNFAYSTVAAAPSPALSGLSLTVQTGDGAKFPAAPFNAVVCPVGVAPIIANAEVVRVTVIVGDVFTLLRQQETGPNRSIQIGDQIFLAATAKTFTDIETALTTEAAARAAADALLAPLASPALTGTPTAPTAAVGTNTTQLATTAFALANTSTPGSTLPTTTGNIAAEPIPSGTGILSTYHNNASLKTIQGMVAGVHNQLWFHYSVGAGQVDFAHLNASGTALGKCRNFVTGVSTSLAPGVGMAAYQYDNGVVSGATAGWRLFDHEQGAPITPAFSAGNYTGGATVILANQSKYSFYLKGKLLTVHNTVGNATTTAGSVPTIACPGGYLAAIQQYFPAGQRGANNGLTISGMVGVNAGVAAINVWNDAGGGTYVAQTGVAGWDFGITFEVT